MGCCFLEQVPTYCQLEATLGCSIGKTDLTWLYYALICQSDFIDHLLNDLEHQSRSFDGYDSLLSLHFTLFAFHVIPQPWRKVEKKFPLCLVPGSKMCRVSLPDTSFIHNQAANTGCEWWAGGGSKIWLPVKTGRRLKLHRSDCNLFINSSKN